MRAAIQSVVDTTFHTHGEIARYIPKGGISVDVFVIPKMPFDYFDSGDTTIAMPSEVFDVRVSEVNVPNEGDRLEYLNDFYTVCGEPRYKDERRMIWQLNVVKDD